MKILVACEFSGIVREAFRAKGHDAWSCDLLPTEIPGNHIQDDVLNHLGDGWDLMIAHPPCQHLSLAGARWFKDKIADGRQAAAIEFFLSLVSANIPNIAIENPIGIMSRLCRKPEQIIQPFQFGHPVQKSTCLWLKNLPLLIPTNEVERGDIYTDPRGHKHGGAHTLRAKQSYFLAKKSDARWMIRSRTFPGIAKAMAEQWGK